MPDEKRAAILIVEDSSDEELLIRRAIQASDIPIEIVIARTTDEAIRLLLPEPDPQAGLRPILVLTDLRVNSIGGSELVSILSQRPETRLIPTVVFTGHASQAQIEELYRRGASSFIEKPMDFEEFAKTITHIVRYWSTVNTAAPHQWPAAGAAV